jgi:hypothetical protein
VVVVDVLGHTVVVVDVVVTHVLSKLIVPKAAFSIALTVVSAPDPASTAIITVESSIM